MKNLYFVKLWKQNKLLFSFILFFCFFQFYFNQKRIHSFPWFVWDMYSRPHVLPEENSQFVLYLDDTIFNHTKLPIWKEETILKTVKMYNWQVQNNYSDAMKNVVVQRTRLFKMPLKNYTSHQILNDSTAYFYYKDWLYNYVQNNCKKKFKKLELKEIKLKFENGQYIQKDIYTIFSEIK
jgi:hypothetical protein